MVSRVLWVSVRGAVLTGVIVIGGLDEASFAQIPFPPPPPKLPEKLPPPSPPVPVLPPVPPAPPKAEPSPPAKVFIHDIQIVGNTILSDEELNAVIKRYRGRELTTEDMEALRLELTLLYVNRGYVTSGAIIPDQAMTFNVLKIQMIEGALSRIDVETDRFLWSGYVRNRVELGVTKPVSVHPLQERLQLLQRDPHIEQLNAELKPGAALGESTLNVQVKETPLFHTRLEFNNYQSPTVGSEQGLVTVEDTNLTGLGDSFSFQYGQSSGIIPIINAHYALPLNRYDTTFTATYRKFDFKVVDSDFESLDIRNDAYIVGFGLRQPLYHTLHDEFAISLTGEYEKNTSTLLGQPFEFVAGATDGVFRVAPFRFAQEYTHQTTEQIIAAFSRFSVGIGWLSASRNSSVPNSATGQFFSWLGEAQWVRQLPFLRTQMVTRTTMQFSNEHLFPLEQIAVGGRYSVRGYREYTFVRDNAFLWSLEFRVPVFTTADGLDRVQLAPFVDVGRSWNTGVSSAVVTTPVAGTTEDRETIASVGIGLRIAFTQTSRFEVYWGQQLNHLEGGTGNLQDHGVHLQLVVQAF
jgi:hemolysin activation/secretion protein